MNPYLSAILGTVCISFASIFVKLADVEPSVSGFFRTFYGSIILILIILFKRKKHQVAIHRKNVGRIVYLTMIPGLIFAFDLYVWHISIPLVGAGMSTIIANTQIFYSVLIGYFFLGERLTREWIYILPIAFVGVVFVGLKNFSLDFDFIFLKGVGYASLAGISYVLFLLSTKRAKMSFPNIPAIYIWCYISTFSCLGLFGLSFLENSQFEISLISHFWLFLLGLIAQAVGWILITSALERANLTHISFILLGQPILSTLWGYIMFNETLTQLQFFGVILVISLMAYGQYLLNRKSVKP